MSGDSSRRKAKACLRCKSKKIKCTGTTPCLSCIRHSVDCVFENGGKKIWISENKFHQLQAKVLLLERKLAESSIETFTPGDLVVYDAETERAAPQHEAPTFHPTPSSRPTIPRPVSHEPSPPGLEFSDATCQSTAETDLVQPSNSLYTTTGHSFTWLFGRNGQNLVANALHGSKEQPDGTEAYESYPMALEPLPDEFPCDEFVEYMVQTTLFHLGPVYYLVDKAKFLARMQMLYTDGKRGVRDESRLWFVQLLLFVALGKLFVGAAPSDIGPPGAPEFLRAMKLLPDITVLHAAPMHSMEVLCLVALYFLSSDRSHAAYCTISQAQSLAVSYSTCQGQMSGGEREHFRRLWWTIYIICVKACDAGGICPSLTEDEVAMDLPENDGGGINSCIRLHAKVYTLTARLSKSAHQVDGDYVAGLERVFVSMTELADEFIERFHITLSRPATIRRTAATLHLAYHQCTIIASRPIFVAQLRSIMSGPYVRPLSEPAGTVFNTCIEAAKSNLKILWVLHQQTRLDPFLPFDTDWMYSAASILSLSRLMRYMPPECDMRLQQASIMLAWMTAKGDRVAHRASLSLQETQSLVEALLSRRGAGVETNLPPFVSTPNWLWDSLDIEEGATNQPLDSMQLNSSVNDGEVAGLFEERWLWYQETCGAMAAADAQQPTARRPADADDNGAVPAI